MFFCILDCQRHLFCNYNNCSYQTDFMIYVQLSSETWCRYCKKITLTIKNGKFDFVNQYIGFSHFTFTLISDLFFFIVFLLLLIIFNVFNLRSFLIYNEFHKILFNNCNNKHGFKYTIQIFGLSCHVIFFFLCGCWFSGWFLILSDLVKRKKLNRDNYQFHY